MKITDIVDARLKKAIKILGIDQFKLTELLTNYQLFESVNGSVDEAAVYTMISDFGSRLKTSRQKQQRYCFYELQQDSFLMLTEAQQDFLIQGLLADLQPVDQSCYLAFDSICDFCRKANLDLVAVMEHIEQTQQSFFVGDISETELAKLLKYFTENASTYVLFDHLPTRAFSNLGYRGISHNLCAAKFQ